MHMLRKDCALAALCVATALWYQPADAAVSPSCQDLRTKIAAMEKQVPSGAALSVDLAIRKVYVQDCLRHPSDGNTPGSSASDPWFNADGNPASGPKPDGDGVFQTTPEIAGYCRGSSDPQLCSLMLNLGEGEMLAEGGDPQDPADWSKPERAIDPADELPPFQLSAGGQTFSVDDACLGGLAGILFSNPGGTGLSQRLALNAATPQCAGELNAISAALGAIQDAIAQWRAAALNDRTAPTDANGRALGPGFLEMCRQAFDNQNTCRARQSGMRSVDIESRGLGSDGQAGAFGDCASLYGSVVAMCQQSGVKFPRSPLKQALQPPKPTPGSADKKLVPKSAAKAQPSQANAPPMSDKCRGLVQDLVNAAKANDGPGAKASYDALEQAGGCGVVSAAPSPPATPAPNPQFVTRGDTSNIDGTFGACDQQPERCDQVANQLKAGTSPAAIAALYANAIGVGLQLGAEMAQGMAALQQPQINMRVPSGRQTDTRSLAAPPIRNGVGQGAPALRPPPQQQTPTCAVGGPGWCTAQ